MDAFDRALATARASFDDIIDNVRIREDFTSLFVSRARELYAYNQIGNYQGLKAQLDRSMGRKGVAADAVYRGLYVEINSTFERGVKAISEAVLAAIQSKVKKYSDLDLDLQKRHSVLSAKILAKLHDGAIHGVKYDFYGLQKNLGICFTDTDPVRLNTDVFTTFMGNCTPDRLEALFANLGLKPPFDDEIGKSSDLKRWSGMGLARDVATAAQAGLEKQIELRNEIVHGLLGGQHVDADDLERASDLSFALLTGFVTKARAALV